MPINNFIYNKNLYMGYATYYVIDFKKYMVVKLNKNFSLRQNMQIPFENVYQDVSGIRDLEEDIQNLSQYYEIHKVHEVNDFIKKNVELIPYINRITPLINNHFPCYKKCLTFSQDPEFDELDDITIYINSLKSEFEADWRKLDELERELFHINEFSTKIKGLVSVDLWLK